MRDDKNGLRYVIVAATAVVFFAAGIPIFDAMGTWVSNIFNLKTLRINKEAETLGRDEASNEPVQAIGFHIPSEDVDDE